MRLLLSSSKEEGEILERGLRAERFCVDLLTDGVSSIGHCRNGYYDLLILDWDVLGTTADEVIRQIRDRDSVISIFVLRSCSDTREKVRLFNLGIDDYLPKPYSFIELVIRIRAVLKRTQRTQVTVALRVGNLILNQATREVRTQLVTATLSPREYALLQYLMERPDCIISRETLHKDLWTGQSAPNSNTVEVVIRSIRRKLLEDVASTHIKTVRGRGYLFRSSLSRESPDL